MENMISLMIFIIAFVSMIVAVAYVADAVACRLVKWLNSVVPNFEE